MSKTTAQQFNEFLNLAAEKTTDTYNEIVTYVIYIYNQITRFFNEFIDLISTKIDRIHNEITAYVTQFFNSLNPQHYPFHRLYSHYIKTAWHSFSDFLQIEKGSAIEPAIYQWAEQIYQWGEWTHKNWLFLLVMSVPIWLIWKFLRRLYKIRHRITLMGTLEGILLFAGAIIELSFWVVIITLYVTLAIVSIVVIPAMHEGIIKPGIRGNWRS